MVWVLVLVVSVFEEHGIFVVRVFVWFLNGNSYGVCHGFFFIVITQKRGLKVDWQTPNTPYQKGFLLQNIIASTVLYESAT